ncbi:hypothetical protein [Kitasatospora acidiphila]|nr:hypothetical protein [Kitasatospora acidiphila]
MRLIGSGLRVVVLVLVNGDPVWPAVGVAAVSVVAAVVVGVLRYRSR